LLANVTASVAKWERKIISLRTTEALAQRRLAGVRLGRPRLPDPQIAERIRTRRAAGITLQAIADELNTEGTSTATGKQWSAPSVWKVVA
jgi:DNA invertase Pin-like site-specific DNA recombinase